MRTVTWLCACGAGALSAGCLDATNPVDDTAIHIVRARSNRAVVIRGDGCALLDGLGKFAYTTQSQKVGTGSGTAKYSCHAKVPPSPTGRAVRYDAEHHPFLPDEFVCGIELPQGLYLTTQWRETVSAAGVATLVCRVPQGSEPHEPS